MQKLGEYIRISCTKKKIAAPPESSGTWASFWKACLEFCKQAHHGQKLFLQKHAQKNLPPPPIAPALSTILYPGPIPRFHKARHRRIAGPSTNPPRYPLRGSSPTVHSPSEVPAKHQCKGVIVITPTVSAPNCLYEIFLSRGNVFFCPPPVNLHRDFMFIFFRFFWDYDSDFAQNAPRRFSRDPGVFLLARCKVEDPQLKLQALQILCYCKL